jgi:hypothetical protein
MRFSRHLIAIAAVMVTMSIGAQVGWAAEAELAQSQWAEQDETEGLCVADCWDGSQVSCSGTTCNVVDSSCPSIRGYVKCGTTTKNCPICPIEICSVIGVSCSYDSTCRPPTEPACSDCFCPGYERFDQTEVIYPGKCYCPVH